MNSLRKSGNPLNAYDVEGQLDVILKRSMSKVMFTNLFSKLYSRIVFEQWTNHLIARRIVKRAVEADERLRI